MKFSFIIFLCLLTSVLCLLTISISSSSSLVSIPERLPMRKLRTLVGHDAHKFHKRKVEEEMKKSSVQEVSEAIPPASGGENSDEPVFYHIDYHGVTTHPTPTPKHPKP